MTGAPYIVDGYSHVGLPRFVSPEVTRDIELPSWVDEQFDHKRPLSLFQNATLEMPMDAIEPLMSDYLRESDGGTRFTFGEFLARRLAARDSL